MIKDIPVIPIYDLHSVNEWLETLPKEADQSLLTSRYLMKALDQLIKSDLSTNIVFLMVEAIRPVIISVIKNILAEYLEGENKDRRSKESESVVRSCLKLLSAMVTAYINIVNRSERLSLEQKLALHRSMAAQVHLQVMHYQLHFVFPGKEWLKLHKLFQYAIKLKIRNFSVADAGVVSNTTSTIHQLYTIALLMGCSRVNNLSSDDIVVVFLALQRWVDLVTISKQADDSGEMQIVVDVGSGLAPTFVKILKSTDSRKLFYLHLGKLISQLDKLSAGMAGENKEFIISQSRVGGGVITSQLIEYLKSAWGEYIYREQRQTTNESIGVCAGIERIHRFLCGGVEWKVYSGEGSLVSGIEDVSEEFAQAESSKTKDVWSTFLSDSYVESTLDGASGEYDFEETLSSAGNKADLLHHLKMTDKSSSGCCLEWPESLAKKFDVGELLGIQWNGEQGLTVGIVKWISHGEESLSKTGVRFMSTRAIPLAVEKAMLFGDVVEHFGMGVLLPHEAGVNSGANVFIERSGLVEGDVVSVTQKGAKQELKLGCEPATHGDHSWYECSVTEG